MEATPIPYSASGGQSESSDRKIVGVFVGVAFLLLVLLSLLSAGVYLWYKNSNISKKISDSKDGLLEQIKEDLKETANSTGSIEVSDTVKQEENETKSESKSTASVDVTVDISNPAQGSQRTVCYKYTIYEGPFKSSKCYSRDDYSALSYYTSEYRSAEFSKESAESTIEFTCDKEYFEDTCQKAKKEKEKAKRDMEKYSVEINQIISRGW